MKQNSLIVALNMSKLPVSQKILRARGIINAIADHPTAFTNPNPTIAAVNAAIDELELAWGETEDGGKSKTVAMHDKEAELMRLMYDLAHYVQSVAGGDETIVHMANLVAKKQAQRNIPDFAVTHGDTRGSVRLRAKKQADTMLKWEYCIDPIGTNAFVTAKITKKAICTFDALNEGTKYWFRVVVLSEEGETIPFAPVSIVAV